MSVESQAPEAAPEAAAEPGAVRLWFAALFRALFVILLTLVILAVLGYAGDVALHRVTRTSRANSSYSQIYEVDIVLDGDGSIAVTGTAVTGTAGNGRQVMLDETDRSTVFDGPQRSVSVIAGTLFVSVHCPDALCSAKLALTTPRDTRINISVGNAFHLDQATVNVENLTGPVDLSAWPAQVTVKNSASLVTGMVAGSLRCDSPAVCIVQVPQ